MERKVKLEKCLQIKVNPGTVVCTKQNVLEKYPELYVNSYKGDNNYISMYSGVQITSYFAEGLYLVCFTAEAGKGEGKTYMYGNILSIIDGIQLLPKL